MAGLDGVENKIHPGEAATKDLYHLPPEEDAKIPTVCSSLDQALEYLDNDRAFLTKGGVFTDATRRLHRAEDAGSHALSHDEPSGRVRHVLLAVARAGRRGRGCGSSARFRAIWGTSVSAAPVRCRQSRVSARSAAGR
jgi:hypothetical protein